MNKEAFLMRVSRAGYRGWTLDPREAPIDFQKAVIFIAENRFLALLGSGTKMDYFGVRDSSTSLIAKLYVDLGTNEHTFFVRNSLRNGIGYIVPAAFILYSYIINDDPDMIIDKTRDGIIRCARKAFNDFPHKFQLFSITDTSDVGTEYNKYYMINEGKLGYTYEK